MIQNNKFEVNNISKDSLRKEFLQIRESMKKAQITNLNVKLYNNLKQIIDFKNIKRISTYMATDNEVQTDLLIKDAFEQDITIIIPVLKPNHQLCFTEINQFTTFYHNKLGILEPTKNCINYTSGINVDLVIVPGIVWNHSGHRIGYGFGYYDKYINLLNKNINTVGLSYEFQIFDNIPIEKYDMPVNKLVTENQIIYCKR